MTLAVDQYSLTVVFRIEYILCCTASWVHSWDFSCLSCVDCPDSSNDLETSTLSLLPFLIEATIFGFMAMDWNAELYW